MNEKFTSKTIEKNGHTFIVNIISCENSSWQGTVEWIQEKKSIPFRSLLELILLIDSTMEEK